jgi:hypothetical protein
LEFTGSVIKEQGITFAVVIVKKHILDNKSEATEIVRNLQARVFPGLPVVLMAQDTNGTPTYYGRSDIAKFLASIHPSRIPWKKYSMN